MLLFLRTINDEALRFAGVPRKAETDNQKVAPTQTEE